GWTISLPDAKIPGYPWNYPKQFLRGNRAIYDIAPWAIAYNSQIVKDPPKQWPDILDARFRGQLIVTDPNISDAYFQIWATIRNKYGDKFLTDLKAQNPRWVIGGFAAAQALVAGEGGILIPTSGSVISPLKDKGAPVNYVVPDVTTGFENSVALTNPAKA